MSESRSVFFELHQRLQHAIVHRLRWRELRPVQEATIRAVRQGHNAIVLAPTAGGKTEAAVFAVLDSLLLNPCPGLSTLYLSPLRALLNNQEERLGTLAQMVGLSAFKWHGDVTSQARARFVRQPAEFLMTTPESLEVILMSQRYDHAALFSELRVVIIDEIHGFAADERGDHLLALLERLQKLSGRDLQRIGLSATVGNPETLLEWLQGGSRRAGEVVNPGAEKQAKIIDIVPLPPALEAARTAALLARGKKTLLFADSRSKVESLKSGLQASGIRAFPHHGSLSRALREETEQAFRAGKNCSIVCTSTMELGLDVGDLDLVLQLGAPITVSSFLQRLGRTGRRPNTVARMTFLCSRESEFLRACALVSLALERWIEPVEVSRSSYPVYVHQVLARVLAGGGASRRELLAEEGGPYCFSAISRQERESILDFMLEQQILLAHDALYLLGPQGEKRFGRSNFLTLYSVFDTPAHLTVRTEDRQEIGQLDSWFVQSSQESLSFVLGGRCWQTLRVDWKRQELLVRPAPRGAIPTWMGEPALMSYRVCQQMRALLLGQKEPSFLSARAAAYLQRVRAEWSDRVSSHPVVVETVRDQQHLLHTFAGGKVNNLIAKYHLARSGHPSYADNLFVRLEGSPSEVFDTLQELGRAPLEPQALSLLVHPGGKTRLSKFQGCLPPDIERRYLAARLFDPSTAYQLCRQFQPPLPKPQPISVDLKQARPTSDDPFIDQLAHLATAFAVPNKWVIVPDHQWKALLGERLCLLGISWLNLRFVTPLELALEVAGPELVHREVCPTPEGLGPPLMIKLCRTLEQSIPLYLRGLIHRPGMAEALWSTLWELRMAGVGSASLSGDSPKQRELSALLQAYEEYLLQHRLADRAEVYRCALSLKDRLRMKPEDLVVEVPSIAWSPLEREWLDALPGHQLKTAVHPRRVPSRLRLLSAPREEKETPFVSTRHLLRELPNQPSSAPSLESSLHFFRAGRKEAEFAEVLRRIGQGTVALDQVEIVVDGVEERLILRDRLSLIGNEATYGSGLPLLSTRTGQAATGILDWVVNDFSAHHLGLLLAGECLAPDGLSPRQALRDLKSSGATWGRETYQTHFRSLINKAEQRDQPETRRRLQTVLEWIDTLLAAFPSQEGSLTLASLASGIANVLSQARTWPGSLEASARVVLLHALKELSSFQSFDLTLAEAAAQVGGRLRGLTCGASRPCPGRPHVTSLREAGLSGRRAVFVTGLEEGRVVPSYAEDPVLSDQERLSLHRGLATSQDRIEESLFNLYERLSCLESQVTLSYSCRDHRTGEELLPSTLFESALRLVPPAIDGATTEEAVGDPVSLVGATEHEAVSESEWWLCRSQVMDSRSEPGILAIFPWLSKGRHAQSQRASSLLTPFDGWVPSLAGLLDPRATKRPTSVSELQDLAHCAFRTFLRRGLRLQPLELARPQTGEWLDALQRGVLLHDLFADFYRTLRKEQRRPQKGDLTLLQELLEARLETLRPYLPPARPSAEARAKQRLLNDLASFLSLELRSVDREPIAFEVGFGLDELQNEPFATKDCIPISVGEQELLLRGRIDRIDRTPDGLEVIDYKTGVSLAKKQGVRFHGGRMIQHALYALVAEQLFGTAVSESSYYFITSDSPKAKLSFSSTPRQELDMLLQDLLEPLRLGAFVQTTEVEQTCRFCDFRPACSGHSKEDIQSKIDSPSAEHLAWRRRLDAIP